MSLWTPSGEHPVTRGTEPPPGQGAPPSDGGPDVETLRRQLADAPADVVVANHCYGLFELAAVYLSTVPPRLDQARLAIDALGAVVDALGDRLGDAQGSLQEALAQIRLAYVQISAAAEHASSAEAAAAAGATGDGAAGDAPAPTATNTPPTQAS